MERILITKKEKAIADHYADKLFSDRNGNFIQPVVGLNCLIWQILTLNKQIEDPIPFCHYIQKIIDEWKVLNSLLPSVFEAKKGEFDKILPEELLSTEILNLPIKPAKTFDPANINGIGTKKFYERISDCLHYEDARLIMGQYYADGIKVKTCVYCNAQPARGSKRKLFYTIDHYKPQSKYPFLCTSFFNLIPSCPYCNSAKNDKDVDFEFYTEDINTAPLKPFRFWVENLNLDDTRNPDDFDIQLRNNDFTQGGLADKHVQDFNLEEMYDGCNEEIEQVIWNYRELASDVYKADKPAEFVEPNKLFRSILGLKSVDMNIHSEELKKLKLDLAMQLRLIDKDGKLLL